MQKDAAKKRVQETLQGSFNKERFVYLIKNILNHVEEAPFTYKGNFIFDDFSDSIRTVERIGKYKGPDEKLLDILVVHLQKETSLERARTKQRNFVAKYLKGSRGRVLKDAGLVAFVAPNGDDWRFSLVKMEYKFNEKGKVEEEFTPARRSSFLVGKNENSHTAQSRLLPLLLDDEVNPTLNDLEDVFSVEKVTKEFFEKYRGLFLRFKESLDEVVKKDGKIRADFKEKNVETDDFAKKLLGQIVFLYFLQKKGWFGVKRGKEWGSGSKHFLRRLFEKKHGNYKNFFNDILEPLFYEALRLERPGDYYSRFDCRIPFLNGGLFDPINDYDWWNTDILLPDDLFSNNRKTKEGDTGDGILDIFDRYNFTVKEDEPLEKEVAVDPEMLGKVFENLLEVKDRKSKGTYYTPREIVHYMCQESLANYLATELDRKASKEDIETLIKYGETVVEHDSRVVSEGRETDRYSFKLPESVRKYAKLIDEKLASIRVCDPAVGSGAFPVGMMNEIVRTRNALTPYLSPSPLMGEGRGEGEERSPYNFKRQAIQNCLYGVDIDPGAVEIAKLRLWLSLIVDEEEREKIQPLPNLDYKIVQGNSLLSVEKTLFNQELFNDLEKLKPFYFDETSASKKQKYKKQIDDLISQITNGHKDFDFEVYFSEVFHEKKGFDVVIANPPYKRIQEIQKDDPNLAKFLKVRYSSASGSYDIYVCFVELAALLIRETGNITYILPHKFFQAAFGKELRKLISSRRLLRQIVDFGHSQIFESATTYTCLLFLSPENVGFKFSEFKSTARTQDLEDLFNLIDRNDHIRTDKLDVAIISGNEATENEWHFSSGVSGSVLKKLKRQPRVLKDVCEKMFQGIATSADKIYFLEHISTNRKNVIAYSHALQKEVCIERDFVRPLLKGADVHRYGKLEPKIWCIFPYKISNGKAALFRQDEIRKKYPLAWRYLLDNRKSLESRENGRMRNERFFAYIYPKNLTEFEQVKIVTPEISQGCNMTYDFKGLCHNTKCYSFVFKKDARESSLFYLSLLNSKLLWFFLTLTGYVLRGGYFTFKTNYLMPFPLPKPLSSAEQKPFIDLVNKIYESRKDSTKQIKGPDYEKQIDQLVYKLYGLTPEEIEIVESS